MDVMGFYMFKSSNNMSYEVMCVTMVDPVMGLLEIVEILAIVSEDKKV